MQVRDRWNEFERRGVRALVISFAPVELLEGYRKDLELPFLIASDPDRRAYRRYGLHRGSFWDIWGPRSLWAYLRLLARGRRLQRPFTDQDLSQLGGDFVINGDGLLRYEHVSRDPSDRPPVDELLDALQAEAEPQDFSHTSAPDPTDRACAPLPVNGDLAVSPFTRELVADLHVSDGSWRGWRRFFTRSLDKSREQIRESPLVVRSILRWMALIAILGAALLGVAFGPGELHGAALTATLYGVWIAGVAAYLILHVGLVRDPHPRGAGRRLHRFGIPNGLSSLRLGLAPLAVYPLLDLGAAPAWIRYVSLATLAAIALSDAADGAWARAFDVRSDLGRTLDPLADLVWICALAVGLFRLDVLPLWVLALVVVRFPGALAGALALYLWRGPALITSTPLGKITTFATLALLLGGAAAVLRPPALTGLAPGPLLPGAMIVLGIVLALGALEMGLRALRWPRHGPR